MYTRAHTHKQHAPIQEKRQKLRGNKLYKYSRRLFTLSFGNHKGARQHTLLQTRSHLRTLCNYKYQTKNNPHNFLDIPTTPARTFTHTPEMKEQKKECTQFPWHACVLATNRFLFHIHRKTRKWRARVWAALSRSWRPEVEGRLSCGKRKIAWRGTGWSLAKTGMPPAAAWELGRRSYTSGPSNCWGHPTKCREGSSGKWLHRPQTPHYYHRVGPHNHSPLCRQRAWECEKGRRVEIANILLQPWTGPEAEIRISLLTKEK